MIDYQRMLSDELHALADEFDLSPTVQRTIAIKVSDDPVSDVTHVVVSLSIGAERVAKSADVSRRELADAFAPEALMFDVILHTAQELFAFATPFDTADLVVRHL